jgi:hypothetical protein
MLSLNWPHPDPFQASMGIGRFDYIGGNNFPGSVITLGSLDVSAWMNMQYGNGNFATEVRPVWDDIRDDDLSRAIVRLENLDSRAARSIEITSLHIPSALAPIAGPLVLWFLLLGLLAHARHLDDMRTTNAEILRLFGWEPLCPGLIARILSFSSIIVSRSSRCVAHGLCAESGASREGNSLDHSPLGHGHQGLCVDNTDPPPTVEYCVHGLCAESGASREGNRLDRNPSWSWAPLFFCG